MLSKKLFGYLGFAAKARKIQAGYNTCLLLLEKKKVKLLLLAEDASEGTRKKMTNKCTSTNTPMRIYGTKDELSQITGRSGNSAFAITDAGFAKAIREEIDRIQAEGEVLNVKKGI